MCNNRVITNIKIVKKIKNHRTSTAEISLIVQGYANVYSVAVYRGTPLCFLWLFIGYAPVSSVAVCITMDESSVQNCWV